MLIARCLVGTVLLGQHQPLGSIQQSETSNQATDSQPQHSNGISATDSSVNSMTILQNLNVELNDSLTRSQEFCSKPAQLYLTSPFHRRHTAFLTAGHGVLLTECFEVVTNLFRVRDEIASEVSHWNSIAFVKGDDSSKTINPDVLENATLITELVSFRTTIAGVCHCLVSCHMLAGSKRTKKKRDSLKKTNQVVAIVSNHNGFAESLIDVLCV